MKGVFSAPGDYIYFKSQVPLHKIPVGLKQWRYYDFGPKVVPPLICLPGLTGTADVYYKQVMALSMKGYRVVSVDIPCVRNHQEWIQAFEKFLDAIDVHHVHLYGTSLGGFLAQLFAQHRPRRVKSLVLSNSFLETRNFAATMPWAPVYSWHVKSRYKSIHMYVAERFEGNSAERGTCKLIQNCIKELKEVATIFWDGICVGMAPSFLLKRYVLSGIRDVPQEPFIADSVDFVVSQVETLSKDDLASRLSLTADATAVGPLLLSDSLVTLMDTNDYSSTPQQLKDEVVERYPGARQAYMKTGGDFPFLSRPDEVNLHLQLHLRRVGVEPRPDLVRGFSKDDSGGGSSSQQEDKREDNDSDSQKDESNKSGNDQTTSPDSQPRPPLEGSHSQDLDGNQVLGKALNDNDSAESLKLLVLLQIYQEQVMYLIAPRMRLLSCSF